VFYFKDEIKLLKGRENVSNEEIEEAKNKPKPQPMQPYILTRDVLQARVVGAGYPSLPVYSVEEFFDQLVDRGCMPAAVADGGNNCIYSFFFCMKFF
jgi:immunoglobulin-binding protein 1